MTFAEDLSQIRTGHGPQVMATLRIRRQPAPLRRSQQHRRRLPPRQPTPNRVLPFLT
jgi:hypothetical protein